jgi:hypothetical protein
VENSKEIEEVPDYTDLSEVENSKLQEPVENDIVSKEKSKKKSAKKESKTSGLKAKLEKHPLILDVSILENGKTNKLEKIEEFISSLEESLLEYERSTKEARRTAMFKVLDFAKLLLVTKDSLSILNNVNNKLQEEYASIENGDSMSINYVKFFSKVPIRTVLKSMKSALVGEDFLNNFKESMDAEVASIFREDMEGLVFALDFTENELLNTDC